MAERPGPFAHAHQVAMASGAHAGHLMPLQNVAHMGEQLRPNEPPGWRAKLGQPNRAATASVAHGQLGTRFRAGFAPRCSPAPSPPGQTAGPRRAARQLSTGRMAVSSPLSPRCWRWPAPHRRQAMPRSPWLASASQRGCRWTPGWRRSCGPWPGPIHTTGRPVVAPSAGLGNLPTRAARVREPGFDFKGLARQAQGLRRVKRRGVEG